MVVTSLSATDHSGVSQAATAQIVDDDVAGAAFIGAAAEMRTGHAERSAQDGEQRSIGIGIDIGLDAIEAESNAGTWKMSALLRLVRRIA